MKQRAKIPLAVFCREFAESLPMGTAIIQVGDVQHPRTWKLLAANSIATHIAGPALSDFLDLPFPHLGARQVPGNLAVLCGKVITRQQRCVVGQIRKHGRNKSREVYMVMACPLPGNCVGILFEDRSQLGGLTVDGTEQKRTGGTARKLSAKLRQTQEQERKRISRELHDSVGQYLTGIRMQIAELQSRGDCPGGLEEKLKECANLVQTCMDEVRSVSYRLYPPEVELMGLIPALRSYARKFAEHSSVSVEMELPEPSERLEADLENALFRIAQECLTNIQRHAQSDSARLRLSLDDHKVTLEIGDGGVGIEPGLLKGLLHGSDRQGLGLLKMRERVHDLKGKLEIESNGQGTLVRVQIPRRSASSGGEEAPSRRRKN